MNNISYKNKKPTDEELVLWSKNKLTNPRTGRKIKKDGPIFNMLNKCLQNLNLNEKKNNDDINYNYYRKNKIDPFTLEPITCKYVFTYPYKWNPYSGKKINEVDKNGPLYFDPANLIQFFYTQRLNNLWIEGDDGYDGYFGDALGNGPDFNIKGRGKHDEWYLFRLPIIDCYLDKEHSSQYVTMGPILNIDELKLIDKLAAAEQKYKEDSKQNKNILSKLYKLYHCAIDKEPYLGFDKSLEQHLFDDDLQYRRTMINRWAVNELIQLKY